MRALGIHFMAARVIALVDSFRRIFVSPLPWSWLGLAGLRRFAGGNGHSTATVAAIASTTTAAAAAAVGRTGTGAVWGDRRSRGHLS